MNEIAQKYVMFDGHAHLAPGDQAREKLLNIMDNLKIDCAIVVAGGTVSPELVSLHSLEGGGIDVDINNEEIVESCKKSNGRLFPFYFANPHKGAEEYLEKGPNYYGLKLGPAVHGIPLNDVRTLNFIETAARLSHPVYLHCLGRSGFKVSNLVEVAKKFPNVPFILGHAGVINLDLQAVDLIEPIENILMETSGGFTYVIKKALNQLGSNRVIFGSEYPLEHPGPELEKFKVLELSKDVWEQVTFRNIYRLIQGGKA